MYHYINESECKFVSPIQAERWFKEVIKQIRSWGAELERPRDTPNIVALTEVAFLAGQYRQMLVLNKTCIEDCHEDIEYINKLLNDHITRFTPEPTLVEEVV